MKNLKDFINESKIENTHVYSILIKCDCNYEGKCTDFEVDVNAFRYFDFKSHQLYELEEHDWFVCDFTTLQQIVKETGMKYDGDIVNDDKEHSFICITRSDSAWDSGVCIFPIDLDFPTPRRHYSGTERTVYVGTKKQIRKRLSTSYVDELWASKEDKKSLKDQLKSAINRMK